MYIQHSDVITIFYGVSLNFTFDWKVIVIFVMYQDCLHLKEHNNLTVDSCLKLYNEQKGNKIWESYLGNLFLALHIIS